MLKLAGVSVWSLDSLEASPADLGSSTKDFGPAKAVYLTSMSRCLPAEALASDDQAACWRTVRYETASPDELEGTMIHAASHVEAPEVSLELGVSGWHAIYVAVWNPHFAYDGGLLLKVKLSGDAAFTRISEGDPPYDAHATYLREVFFREDNLTGQRLILGKANGPFGRKACVAYVKLVPLSDERVARLKQDRADRSTRRLQSGIDGYSFFGGAGYGKDEHFLELVERYRHSDVGKVIWAFNYGDLTNYPSTVGTFLALPKKNSLGLTPSNNRSRLEKYAVDALSRLAKRGVTVQDLVAKHVRGFGVKFDAMIRLAITNPPPPAMGIDSLRNSRSFVTRYPELRLVTKEGVPVSKASYAYPQVREFMLSLVREVAENFEIDGVNLCFIRGPAYVMYEPIVQEDFQKRHDEEARKVPLNDPRLVELRCHYLTQFVRSVRDLLDRVGERKGRRLELSAWVHAGISLSPSNLLNGLDLRTWIGEGLLDSIISHGRALDPELIRLAKQQGCAFIYNPFGGDWVADVSQGYKAGADGIAAWDMESVQDKPEVWEWLRQTGHRETLATYAQQPLSEPKRIRLRSVGGVDVFHSLWEAAYSGG
jgi:hypothetical protein